jgi:hypothetical protein
MAIMNLSSKMVYWKVEFDNKDMTALFRDHIESISVKRSVLPPPKNSESDSAPSEATISVISKSYLEDLFVEGTKVDIYMGYDRIITKKNRVFSGVINELPDGDAQEMTKYNIRAYGNEIMLSLVERSGSHGGKSKTQIIRDILNQNEYQDFDIEIDIDDDAIPATSYSPMQIGKTDLEMLTRLAAKWGCRMWIEIPKKIYFVDSDKIQTYKSVYLMGYRTDRYAGLYGMGKDVHTVESVSWKHKPQPIYLIDNNGGVVSLGQLGEVKGIENFKLIVQGKTYRVRPEVVKDIKKAGKPEKVIGDMISYILDKTFSWQAYIALHRYYELVDGDDNSHKIPSDENSGMEIDIKLNEGDPGLIPPRKGYLSHGSMNPRADSSWLPNFLSRWGPHDQLIVLNINETVLTLKSGRLESELKCTIGNTEL